MKTIRRDDRSIRHSTQALGAIALGALLVFGFACRGMGTAPPPAPAPAPDPPAPESPAPEPDAPPMGDEEPDLSDASLHDRVHAALQRAPELEGTDVSVRVEGSTVYLGGHVHTADQKRIAHNVAHAVEGVSRVIHDGIDVRR